MITTPFYVTDKEWFPDENHWEPLYEPEARVIIDPDLILVDYYNDNDNDFELPF